MIKQAAIKVKDNIYTLPRPNRHVDIRRNFNISLMARYQTEGFITDEDIFVNRIEAMKIAKECNQSLIDFWADLDISKELYTENLW